MKEDGLEREGGETENDQERERKRVLVTHTGARVKVEGMVCEGGPMVGLSKER